MGRVFQTPTNIRFLVPTVLNKRNLKDKSVPLEARGAQRIPGSYGSQIT